MTLHTRQGLTALFIAAAAAGACSREEPAAPVAQAQTQSVQKPNVPTLVTGCLRAGEATDTFVLTSSQTMASLSGVSRAWCTIIDARFTVVADDSMGQLR